MKQLLYFFIFLCATFSLSAQPNQTAKRLPILQDYKFGFIDYSGNVIVPTDFDAATTYHKHIAFARKGSFWGVIDTLGNTVIDFNNSHITYNEWSQTFYAITADSTHLIFDNKGKQINKLTNVARAFMLDKYFVFANNNATFQTYPIHKSLEVHLNKNAQQIVHTTNHYLIYLDKNNKYVFIDKEGKTIGDSHELSGNLNFYTLNDHFTKATDASNENNVYLLNKVAKIIQTGKQPENSKLHDAAMISKNYLVQANKQADNTKHYYVYNQQGKVHLALTQANINNTMLFYNDVLLVADGDSVYAYNLTDSKLNKAFGPDIQLIKDYFLETNNFSKNELSHIVYKNAKGELLTYDINNQNVQLIGQFPSFRHRDYKYLSADFITYDSTDYNVVMHNQNQQRYIGHINAIENHFTSDGFLWVKNQEGKYMYLNKDLKVIWEEATIPLKNKLNTAHFLTFKYHFTDKNTKVNYGSSFDIKIDFDTLNTKEFQHLLCYDVGINIQYPERKKEDNETLTIKDAAINYYLEAYDSVFKTWKPIMQFYDSDNIYHHQFGSKRLLVPAITGHIKTKLRVTATLDNLHFHSNEIIGWFNPTQFSNPTHLVRDLHIQ